LASEGYQRYGPLLPLKFVQQPPPGTQSRRKRKAPPPTFTVYATPQQKARILMPMPPPPPPAAETAAPLPTISPDMVHWVRQIVRSELIALLGVLAKAPEPPAAAAATDSVQEEIARCFLESSSPRADDADE
jgi:hypothetical protein